MPVKFQSDMIIITSILTALRLHKIWLQDVLPLSEYRGPVVLPFSRLSLI